MTVEELVCSSVRLRIEDDDRGGSPWAVGRRRKPGSVPGHDAIARLERTRSAMRVPLSIVPFLLPRSRIAQPSPSRSMARC